MLEQKKTRPPFLPITLVYIDAEAEYVVARIDPRDSQQQTAKETFCHVTPPFLVNLRLQSFCDDKDQPDFDIG